MSLRVDNATSVTNALSTTDEVIATARATRRQMTVINLDAAISVYINMGAVATSANATVPPGGTVVVLGTGEWHGLAASGTPSISVIDEYD